MGGFVHFVFNLSLSLDCAWLSEQIIANEPYTVRVIDQGGIVPNPLLQIFAKDVIPWSIHEDLRSLPPRARHSDIMLILSNNQTRIEKVINIIARYIIMAHRSRYMVVHLNYIEDGNVREIANHAWKSGLHYVSVVRPADRSIFVVEPLCRLPRVMRAKTVQWPDLRKLNLSDCTLIIGVYSVDPFFELYVEDGALQLDGSLVPLFKFAQSGLKFKAHYVPMSYRDLIDNAKLGYLPGDMILTFVARSHGWTIDVAGVWFQHTVWCVPDFCEFHDTTYLLWQEFSISTWILIIISVTSVSTALALTASAPGLTFGESVLRVLPALAAAGAKLPGGHARWALSGWLWATLVLTSCYQSILHSMMTAPAAGYQIENVEQLSESDLALRCYSHVCALIRYQANKTRIKALEVIADNMLTVTPGMQVDPGKFAIPSDSTLCTVSYDNMRALMDFSYMDALGGYAALSKDSWLAPALYRNYYILEATGLAERWVRKVPKPRSCLPEGGEKAIAFHLLRPAFLLMGLGYSLATVSFLAELLLARYQNASRPIRTVTSADVDTT